MVESFEESWNHCSDFRKQMDTMEKENGAGIADPAELPVLL